MCIVARVRQSDQQNQPSTAGEESAEKTELDDDRQVRNKRITEPGVTETRNTLVHDQLFQVHPTKA
jgi:hypothetical protein